MTKTLNYTYRIAPEDFLVTVKPNGLFLNLTS